MPRKTSFGPQSNFAWGASSPKEVNKTPAPAVSRHSTSKPRSQSELCPQFELCSMSRSCSTSKPCSAYESSAKSKVHWRGLVSGHFRADVRFADIHPPARLDISTLNHSDEWIRLTGQRV